MKGIMRRTMCLTLVCSLLFGFTARADEGMWLLPLIEKMNKKALKKAGCKMSTKEIYNANDVSLKDAIVQFGGGCTAEIISDEGLLITNHHCGYGNIQKLSSVENDYLSNGFWAMNRSEELPCEGLTVTFIEYMLDVTDMLKDKSKEEILKDFQTQYPNCGVHIVDYYNKNVFYLVVEKTYRDIRFVGAPPSSIGKFGADTDNWMWPRHTCDFSMFRVYAGKDNEPADYSADNQPLRPKKHLKISLKGVKEGDYTMIMGFPGRTNRFATSCELKTMLKLNDIRIDARTIRQDVLMEDMLSDQKINIQYASKYSRSSNGWKKWKGMKLAFANLGILERAEKEEADFQIWAVENEERKAKYGNVLANLQKGSELTAKNSEDATKIIETLVNIEISTISAAALNEYRNCLRSLNDTSLAIYASLETLKGLYKDYSLSTDKKVAKAMFEHYYKIADKECLPFKEDFDIDEYLTKLYSESVFTSYEKAEKAIKENPDVLKTDPAMRLYSQIVSIYFDKMKASEEGNKILAEARQLYTAGLLEWKKNEPSYPDANFTMRMTYGKVMGYSPKDAVEYSYHTTLEGVMEKEDPNNWEFVVPEKLKEIYNTQNFGIYAMKDGKMPTCFLSNNDITGGNSGSPIMNAKGELIGLAFDGNWESMSSDIMFEPNLQRCINVDIRYVLLIVDKFGGAGYLIDEMDIVK